MEKLILGTVQMGLNYGINNSFGKISTTESQKILIKAFSSGVTTLDTAESYGTSHQVIGKFHKNNPNYKFEIVTKVPHDIELDSIKTRVKEYLEVLGVNSLEVLMFHSFDSFQNNYKAIHSLVELKLKGLIKHLGVSVYTNDQLEKLLNEDLITVVQLPFNMLDNINVRGDLLNQLKKKGKLIHTRSAFLQGLFFKNTNDKTLVVQKLKPELERLNQIILESNCSMEELALSYCLIQENIDNVIIGVDSRVQLNESLKASSYEIGQDIIKLINDIEVKDLDLLNPSLWK
tara:strand:- start:205 stop:1071 length:867 start_codon:yes stop_codon:yes gene_type:complete